MGRIPNSEKMKLIQINEPNSNQSNTLVLFKRKKENNESEKEKIHFSKHFKFWIDNQRQFCIIKSKFFVF